jgi:hypothetical protein
VTEGGCSPRERGLPPAERGRPLQSGTLPCARAVFPPWIADSPLARGVSPPESALPPLDHGDSPCAGGRSALPRGTVANPRGTVANPGGNTALSHGSAPRCGGAVPFAGGGTPVAGGDVRELRWVDGRLQGDPPRVCAPESPVTYKPSTERLSSSDQAPMSARAGRYKPRLVREISVGRGCYIGSLSILISAGIPSFRHAYRLYRGAAMGHLLDLNTLRADGLQVGRPGRGRAGFGAPLCPPLRGRLSSWIDSPAEMV